MDPANSKPKKNLVDMARALMEGCGADGSGRWLLVDVHVQALHLMDGAGAVRTWPVSTGEAGVDNRDGSGGTPPGLHRIGRRIGGGAETGTVFESREPTGAVWRKGEPEESDLILTRILTLDGCEDGLNRGPDVDSRERYIYIHGTNHEDAVGRPVSHGCVRMTNHDVVELFDRVAEGDPVVIL